MVVGARSENLMFKVAPEEDITDTKIRGVFCTAYDTPDRDQPHREHLSQNSVFTGVFVLTVSVLNVSFSKNNF